MENRNTVSQAVERAAIGALAKDFVNFVSQLSNSSDAVRVDMTKETKAVISIVNNYFPSAMLTSRNQVTGEEHHLALYQNLTADQQVISQNQIVFFNRDQNSIIGTVLKKLHICQETLYTYSILSAETYYSNWRNPLTGHIQEATTRYIANKRLKLSPKLSQNQRNIKCHQILFTQILLRIIERIMESTLSDLEKADGLIRVKNLIVAVKTNRTPDLTRSRSSQKDDPTVYFTFGDKLTFERLLSDGYLPILESAILQLQTHGVQSLLQDSIKNCRNYLPNLLRSLNDSLSMIIFDYSEIHCHSPFSIFIPNPYLEFSDIESFYNSKTTSGSSKAIVKKSQMTLSFLNTIANVSDRLKKLSLVEIINEAQIKDQLVEIEQYFCENYYKKLMDNVGIFDTSKFNQRKALEYQNKLDRLNKKVVKLFIIRSKLITIYYSLENFNTLIIQWGNSVKQKAKKQLECLPQFFDDLLNEVQSCFKELIPGLREFNEKRYIGYYRNMLPFRSYRSKEYNKRIGVIELNIGSIACQISRLKYQITHIRRSLSVEVQKRDQELTRKAYDSFLFACIALSPDKKCGLLKIYRNREKIMPESNIVQVESNKGGEGGYCSQKNKPSQQPIVSVNSNIYSTILNKKNKTTVYESSECNEYLKRCKSCKSIDDIIMLFYFEDRTYMRSSLKSLLYKTTSFKIDIAKFRDLIKYISKNLRGGWFKKYIAPPNKIQELELELRSRYQNSRNSIVQEVLCRIIPQKKEISESNHNIESGMKAICLRESFPLSASCVDDFYDLSNFVLQYGNKKQKKALIRYFDCYGEGIRKTPKRSKWFLLFNRGTNARRIMMANLAQFEQYILHYHNNADINQLKRIRGLLDDEIIRIQQVYDSLSSFWHTKAKKLMKKCKQRLKNQLKYISKKINNDELAPDIEEFLINVVSNKLTKTMFLKFIAELKPIYSVASLGLERNIDFGKSKEAMLVQLKPSALPILLWLCDLVKADNKTRSVLKAKFINKNKILANGNKKAKAVKNTSEENHPLDLYKSSLTLFSVCCKKNQTEYINLLDEILLKLACIRYKVNNLSIGDIINYGILNGKLCELSNKLNNNSQDISITFLAPPRFFKEETENSIISKAQLRNPSANAIDTEFNNKLNEVINKMKKLYQVCNETDHPMSPIQVFIEQYQRISKVFHMNGEKSISTQRCCI